MKEYKNKNMQYLPGIVWQVFKYVVIAGAILNIVYAIWQQYNR